MAMIAGVLVLSGIAVADDEAAFRASMEARKDRLLLGSSVRTRVMTSAEQIARARRNIRNTDWGRKWFEQEKAVADYLISQPDSYIESMVPELTPTSSYGFTCPNCVGVKSQEGVGAFLFDWDYRDPDRIRCKLCGQTYPDPKFPEQGRMDCPRSGQTLTYYLTEAERQHPEDKSGKYAWHWVGMPIRVSFEGVVRHKKAIFAASAALTLARLYDFTGDERYARTGITLLTRLAQCYRNWLYHDYWATFADCDPLYAAWHDRDLPRDWKLNPSESAYKDDPPGRGRMLQSYWGAGRIHPSTDSVSALSGLCTAYDTLRPLMTSQQRTLVERDLLLEWVMGAEPYLGGENKAANVTNKAPSIYLGMAAVGKCLNIPDFVDTPLRGYEGIRDQSFIYDGFSKESPDYTNMYLGTLLALTESLHGYRWPSSFDRRTGTVNLYLTDARLRLMFRSVVDQLRGDGRYLPLSDTQVNARPASQIIEIGMKRYPEYYAGVYLGIRSGAVPGGYALFNLEPRSFQQTAPLNMPEILYPAWMTAILRNGLGPESSCAALTFSPWGGHRHTDNLSLFYSDRGDAVLDELGYVGDMPTRSWAGNTLSHNLVIVDDARQLNNDRRPRFELMATTPGVSVVEASSKAYDQCSDYRRLVALIKGPGSQTFAVDIFRVAGGKKHAFQIISELAASDAPNSGIVFRGLSMPPEPPLPNVGSSIERDDVFGLRDVRADSAPPASWEATWEQDNRSYRLHLLSQVDRVEASNGPGQTARTNAGRRARYLNAIREGESVRSTFVAVHEPSGIDGMPVRSAVRLAVPESAGPNAVALKIESDWGVYRIFSEFDRETEVDGVRFQGKFGMVCEPPDQAPWIAAVGAATLQSGEVGFSGATPRWTGMVTDPTENEFTASTSRPADWPQVPEGCRSFASVDTGAFVTGFAVSAAEAGRIDVQRFPLPASAVSFDWSALRFMRGR